MLSLSSPPVELNRYAFHEGTSSVGAPGPRCEDGAGEESWVAVVSASDGDNNAEYRLRVDFGLTYKAEHSWGSHTPEVPVLEVDYFDPVSGEWTPAKEI